MQLSANLLASWHFANAAESIINNQLASSAVPNLGRMKGHPSPKTFSHSASLGWSAALGWIAEMLGVLGISSARL